MGRSEECAQEFAPHSLIHNGLNQKDPVSSGVFLTHSDQCAGEQKYKSSQIVLVDSLKYCQLLFTLRQSAKMGLVLEATGVLDLIVYLFARFLSLCAWFCGGGSAVKLEFCSLFSFCLCICLFICLSVCLCFFVVCLFICLFLCLFVSSLL